MFESLEKIFDKMSLKCKNLFVFNEKSVELEFIKGFYNYKANTWPTKLDNSVCDTLYI